MIEWKYKNGQRVLVSRIGMQGTIKHVLYGKSGVWLYHVIGDLNHPHPGYTLSDWFTEDEIEPVFQLVF